MTIKPHKDPSNPGSVEPHLWLTARELSRPNAETYAKVVLCDQQACKEWFGDCGTRRQFFVTRDDRDKLVVAVQTVPKMLNFLRADALIPLESKEC